MRLAVDLAKRCVSEDRGKPLVGAVVVKDGNVLGSGFRGETGEGDHAEYGILKRLCDIDLAGAVVFTTLEPCSRRKTPMFIPCAQRLVNVGVSEVHIGIYDPNPVIYRQGWRILRDAGVRLRDFPADLREEIAVDNADFIAQYKGAVGDVGQFSLDSLEGAGSFTVETSIGKFNIQTSPMGPRSVWLLDQTHKVAAVRYAKEFDEIDDPGALTFSSRYAAFSPHQIACLRNERGYLLLKNVSDDAANVIHVLYQARGASPEASDEEP
jgi:diaminohydroxyphosphoribosylaminopyrimidine deaminase/5-amino-6-(5-phosphoribosylamino)uracil reductase